MSEYISKKALEALGKPDSDDILLREALAKFLADDMNEGGKTISKTINKESEKYEKYVSRRLNIEYCFIIIFMFTFLISIILPEKMINWRNAFFGVSLLSLVCMSIPRILIKKFQYGRATPESPLDLPYPANERIDAFVAPLQEEFGPKAYYFSAWRRKRKTLDHRQFFGKLRYQSFSEHGRIRKLVMRYPTAFPLPQDIFLRRSDLQKMIEDSKPESKPEPKRQGGPGRTPNPRYNDALIALLLKQKFSQVCVSDEAEAISEISKIFTRWFEENADASGWIPRSDQIKPYAEKIYVGLKNLTPPK